MKLISKIKSIFVTLFFLLLVFQTSAQKTEGKKIDYLKIGDQVNYVFKDVINYPAKQIDLKKLRGKWVLIDFWARGCSGCIASFPKQNKLSEQFSDKIQFIMVGIHSGGGTKKGSSERITKEIFDIQTKKHNLHLTAAFDTAVMKAFDIDGVPDVLVINPEGKLVARAITLDSTQLNLIVNEKMPEYERSYAAHEIRPDNKYRYNLPLLTTGQNGNGGIDTSFIYRSILVNWTPKMRGGWSGFDNTFSPLKNTGEAFGQDLTELVRIAYTGKPFRDNTDTSSNWLYNKIIFETKDTASFTKRTNTNDANKYCYSITINLDHVTKKDLRDWMLVDLQRIFHFKSQIKSKIVPVWKLVVIDPAKVNKLKTKGGKMWNEELYPIRGFSVTNYSMTQLVVNGGFELALKRLYRPANYTEVPPILDSTGIKFNIDLTIKADRYVFSELKEALNQQGLDLVQDTAEMNCIVILP